MLRTPARHPRHAVRGDGATSEHAMVKHTRSNSHRRRTTIAQVVVVNEGASVGLFSKKPRIEVCELCGKSDAEGCGSVHSMLCRTQRSPNDPHLVRRSWSGTIAPRGRSHHQVPDAARRGWAEVAHPLLIVRGDQPQAYVAEPFAQTVVFSQFEAEWKQYAAHSLKVPLM